MTQLDAAADPFKSKGASLIHLAGPNLLLEKYLAPSKVGRLTKRRPLRGGIEASSFCCSFALALALPLVHFCFVRSSFCRVCRVDSGPCEEWAGAAAAATSFLEMRWTTGAGAGAARKRELESPKLMTSFPFPCPSSCLAKTRPARLDTSAWPSTRWARLASTVAGAETRSLLAKNWPVPINLQADHLKRSQARYKVRLIALNGPK